MAYQARIAVAAGLMLVTAMPVTAQDRFVHVQYALRPGDTVFVVDDTGTETRGKVARIEPSALRLIVDGYERDWGAAAVERLERRGDSLKNGAIAGLWTGGIFGLLFAIAAVDGAGGGAAVTLVPSGGQIAGVFGAFMGLGAGIGAGIDALVPGRQRSRFSYASAFNVLDLPHWGTSRASVPGVLPITILAAGNSWSLNPAVLSSRPVLTYLNGVGVACGSFMRWLLVSARATE